MRSSQNLVFQFVTASVHCIFCLLEFIIKAINSNRLCVNMCCLPCSIPVLLFWTVFLVFPHWFTKTFALSFSVWKHCWICEVLCLLQQKFLAIANDQHAKEKFVSSSFLCSKACMTVWKLCYNSLAWTAQKHKIFDAHF